ncbi:MAG: hypothetical protein JO142_20055 [Burkholderiales bacterium]|nr:hypothetical protein [Burkholderiales bacterium]
MTMHILPAGTDIAEMAFFAVDAVPTDVRPKPEAIESLRASGKLIRFPTGADGGYLLHLYVDEVIPPELMRYCDVGDPLSGIFHPDSGEVAFGGMETVFLPSGVDQEMRSDTAIPAGDYEYTAYRTEYPEGFVKSITEQDLTPFERSMLAAPGFGILFTVAATAYAVLAQRYMLAGGLVITAIVLLRALFRNPGFKALQARRHEQALNFPSIVVALRSKVATQEEPAT